MKGSRRAGEEGSGVLPEELPQLDHPLQILTADVEVVECASAAAADQHAAFAHPRAEFGRQRR